LEKERGYRRKEDREINVDRESMERRSGRR